MATEIERKFIVDELPVGLLRDDGTHLRQGYLAEDGDVSLRVRIAGESATLTVKAGRGRSRTEVEVPISNSQAEALWPLTEGRRVVKTRWRVPLGDAARLVAEVDDYHDDLDGLRTVEVEFESDKLADSFVPPSWFGREVTADAAWTNAALARDGRPPN